MKNIYFGLVLSFLILLQSCKTEKIQLIVFNAKIYTVNSDFDVVQAMAINNGKIIALGSSKDIKSKYSAEQEFDAQEKAIYPGFIDAHAHFVAYAERLNQVNLVATKSWTEVLQKLQDFAKSHPDSWLVGGGWDQNDWDDKSFPDKTELDKLFPNRPVYLSRIDGHAAIVNQKALDEVGILKPLKIVGGAIVMKNNKMTGVLVDNAMDLVSKKIPPISKEQLKELLLKAQNNCFAVGLTTIDDCGLNFETLENLMDFQQSGTLKMKLYVLLSDKKENYDYLIKKGKIKTDRINVRGFKVFADGALGSRGACLLHPYTDMPSTSGFMLSSKEHFLDVAQLIAKHDFQMCTHAIGDSANRTLLNIYNQVLNGNNDKRWRIEHAQIINPQDFKLFATSNIIPSVQPTHATSDMYWAKDRLGNERVKSAYPYQQLLQENGWLALGTDFPVEDINPMFTYYAATARKDASGFPKGGFQMENALTPEQALKGMTIWAAKANFEEDEKGSLEVGKMADFVILQYDLFKASDKEILDNKVIRTYINGEKVYEKK